MRKKNNVMFEISVKQQPTTRKYEQHQEHIGLRSLYCGHKIVSFYIIIYHKYVIALAKENEVTPADMLDSTNITRIYFSLMNLVLSRSIYNSDFHKSIRKAMNRNWSNQKANPALKTKAGNK